MRQRFYATKDCCLSLCLKSATRSLRLINNSIFFLYVDMTFVTLALACLYMTNHSSRQPAGKPQFMNIYEKRNTVGQGDSVYCGSNKSSLHLSLCHHACLFTPVDSNGCQLDGFTCSSYKPVIMMICIWQVLGETYSPWQKGMACN